MKTVYKYSIAGIVSIVAILITVTALGVFAVSHYYTASSPPVEKASIQDRVIAQPNNGPLGDRALVQDSVSITKTALEQQIYGPQIHPMFLGVVHLVAKHADGSTFWDYTSHNTRLVQGINCLEQAMFNPNNGLPLNTNGTNVCKGLVLRGTAGWNGFNIIGLVNGSSGGVMTANGSDTATLSKCGCGAAPAGTRASANDGLLLAGTVPANQGGAVLSTVAGTATFNQITITSPTFTFTGDKAAGTNVRGAFLMNNTAANAASDSDAAWAENSFTSIGLLSTDTLTVTWTITIS